MNTSFRNKLTANSSPKANNGSFAFTNMKEASNKVPNKSNRTSPANNGSTLSNFLNPSNANSTPKNNIVAKNNSSSNIKPSSFMDSLPSFPSSPSASASASPNKMNTFTSFQPIESIKNMHKNMLHSDTMKSFTSPIKESFHQVVENGASSVISIPIILALGFFVILFIIAVIFREQVEFALTVSWQKIKAFFEGKDKANAPVPLPVLDPTEKLNLVDYAAINNNMPGKKDGKEVFNIAVDKYAYDDAEPLCKSFGAELATYDQVKEAWKKGADWCNYGWVKGQSAVFPTQKETYDKLQNGPESERMSCGVPGVNGGYFDNPALRFGVNCYGEKPSENDTDIRQKMSGKSSKTPGALAYDKKVQDFTAERNQIPLNSFNSTTW